MEMKKCEKGHYYDASMHTSCPYCNNVRNTEMTVAMGVQPPVFSAGQAESTGQSGDLERTVAMGMSLPNSTSDKKEEKEDNEKTVAMFRTSQGVDPVVGWLVRLNGKDRGQDYKIHAENNYIGRSEKMDICIKNDDTISRENQAILTFDVVEKKFYFSPGEGRSVVRHNEKALLQTIELKADDKITVGQTELLFVPLCGASFDWNEE